MLVILLSVFTLCWLPFQIAIIYGEYRPNKHEPVSIVLDSHTRAKSTSFVSLAFWIATNKQSKMKEKSIYFVRRI